MAERLKIYEHYRHGRLLYSWILGTDNITGVNKNGVPVIQGIIQPFRIDDAHRSLDIVSLDKTLTESEIHTFRDKCRIITDKDSACMCALLSCMKGIIKAVQKSGLLPVGEYVQELSRTAQKQFRKCFTKYIVRSALDAVCTGNKAHFLYLCDSRSALMHMAESLVQNE